MTKETSKPYDLISNTSTKLSPKSDDKDRSKEKPKLKYSVTKFLEED